jgi:phosphoribosylformylglycinamidine (FGAM) synthase-like enzyme
MPSSTKAQIQEKRRDLVACGVDPYELVAQLLVRNEELHEQVQLLQRIVNRR